ncbi:MAG: PDZ domain-containing protein, partial [bacterium]
AQNIGFAIPANRASQIVDHLIRFGEVKPGYIGLRVQNFTTQLAEAMEIPHQKGVVVHNIDKGSPAAHAGIRAGDIIITVDGHAPRSEHEFEERLAHIPEGTSFTVSVLRESGPSSVAIVAAPITDAVLDEIGWRRLGLATGSPHAGGGVRIARVRENSHAARSGLRTDDILLAIEEHSTNSGDNFRAAIADLRRDDQARVAVRRNRAAYRLSLHLED